MSNDITEGLKEVARAILGNERPTDRADVGTPSDFAGGGGFPTSQNDDYADDTPDDEDPSSYARTGLPRQGPAFVERSLAVPGGAPGYPDSSTPMLDATEFAVEHGDPDTAGIPEEAGYRRVGPVDVRQVGGDTITTMRIAVPAGGFTQDPVMRGDRRRLRARLRVVTAGKTVYIGQTQAASSGNVGWPVSDTDGPIIIETQGDLWVRSSAAEVAIIAVALLVETRNMPDTI